MHGHMGFSARIPVKTGRPLRLLMMSLVVALLLQPCPVPIGGTALAHEHPMSGQDNGGYTGVEEHLGGKIPLDATFRDETGKPVRLGELITVPTIILPVYYSCTNVCNFLQGGVANVLPSVKRKPGEEYRVISVSFDETETPALASRYKRMYLTSMHAPFPVDGWRFLTGDAANIRRLTDAAGYHFLRRGREFIHPVASFVVARDGTIVRYFYGTTFLSKDLTLALLEARDGKTGATVRKVVGFCFSFDPKEKTYVFNLLRVSATVVLVSMGVFLSFLLLTGNKHRRSRSGKS